MITIYTLSKKCNNCSNNLIATYECNTDYPQPVLQWSIRCRKNNCNTFDRIGGYNDLGYLKDNYTIIDVEYKDSGSTCIYCKRKPTLKEWILHYYWYVRNSIYLWREKQKLKKDI